MFSYPVDHFRAVKRKTGHRGVDYMHHSNRGLYNYQPTLNIFIPWTPYFAHAYQQFVNSVIPMQGGSPHSGMGGMLGGSYGYLPQTSYGYLPKGGYRHVPKGGYGHVPNGSYGGMPGGRFGVVSGGGVPYRPRGGANPGLNRAAFKFGKVIGNAFLQTQGSGGDVGGDVGGGDVGGVGGGDFGGVGGGDFGGGGGGDIGGILDIGGLGF